MLYEVFTILFPNPSCLQMSKSLVPPHSRNIRMETFLAVPQLPQVWRPLSPLILCHQDTSGPYRTIPGPHSGALKVSSQLCRLSRTLILLNWWSLLSFLSVLLALLVSLLQLQTSHFQAIQPSGWAILGLNYFHKILSPAFLFFLFHELHEVSTLSNLHLPLSLLCCEATNWGAWLLVLLLVIIV